MALTTVWAEGGTLTIWKEARGVPATAVQVKWESSPAGGYRERDWPWCEPQQMSSMTVRMRGDKVWGFPIKLTFKE